jgi:EpsI family protein
MTRLRLVLVLVFVSLPLVAARLVDLRSVSPLHYDARALPDQIDSHRLLHEEVLEPEVVAMLSPESYTMRLYGDGADSNVWLYFAIYSSTGTTGAHDPAVCYPAQGWDASAPTERELVLASGDRMAVKSMSAILGGKEERVLYWFQPAKRWPTYTPRELFERMLDGFAGRPQYGFVRLSIALSRPDDEARAAADAKLAELGKALAPLVRRSLAGGSEDAGLPRDLAVGAGAVAVK